MLVSGEVKRNKGIICVCIFSQGTRWSSNPYSKSIRWVCYRGGACACTCACLCHKKPTPRHHRSAQKINMNHHRNCNVHCALGTRNWGLFVNTLHNFPLFDFSSWSHFSGNRDTAMLCVTFRQIPAHLYISQPLGHPTARVAAVFPIFQFV